VERSRAKLITRAWTWWRHAARGPRSAALLGVAGLVILCCSLLPGEGIDDGWARDFMMTVGSSVALFVLFYAVTRSLDTHLDKVATDTAQQVQDVRDETAQQVEGVRAQAAEASSALSGEVEALRADVDRRIEDVFERVTARLQAEVAADAAAFAALRSPDITRGQVWDALVRALGLGLISLRRPPRVRISLQQPIYASFEIDTDEMAEEPLQLRVETINGVVEDRLSWGEDMSTADSLVWVGRALRKHTGEVLAPGGLLSGLADLLETAASHSQRRPAIELCAPQWVVCDWGVAATDRDNTISLDRLRNPRHAGGVAAKTWVDEESWNTAHVAALSLFGTARDPWGASNGEPPF
jgi:hypothetical protein